MTFLPRNLFEQFHRVAYIYSLLIAILNQLPQLAVFGRGASIMPLAFCLLQPLRMHMKTIGGTYQTGLRITDWSGCLPTNSFIRKNGKIWVGEIIKISRNESIPCDMVLLSTSDYTDYKLDGESNLKTQYAKQETHMKIRGEERISGLIKCEKPNRNIYGFHANMDLDGKRISIGPSNIVLRRCELKNTDWTLGVAVYAGGETKAMLNNSGAPSKRSRIEIHMNRKIVFLSIFLVLLCTVVSIGHGVWIKRHKDELDMMHFTGKMTIQNRKSKIMTTMVGEWRFFVFLMSVIVFQIMIPVSLYISMELVRVGQAYFMIHDDRMLDQSSNSRFQCRALNINEDLGQIKYVFSDKTGTLTENKMEFKCASVGGLDFSSGKADSEKEQIECFSALGLLEFDSDRKRMSVILGSLIRQ